MNTIKSRFVISLSVFGLFVIIISLLGFDVVQKATEIREYQNKTASIANDISRLIAMDLKLINVEYKEEEFYKSNSFTPLSARQSLFLKVDRQLDSISANRITQIFHLKQDFFVGKKLLQKYDSLQIRLLDLKKKRGFKDMALEGEMRNYVHQLERNPGILTPSDILTLRRHEKDYFLRNEPQYIDKLTQLSSNLQVLLISRSPEDVATLELLENYTDAFIQITEIEYEIGNNSSGLLKDLYLVHERLLNKINAIRLHINQSTTPYIRGMINKFLLIIVLGFVLTCVICYFIAHVISNSIKQLDLSMKQIIKSNFSEKPIPPGKWAASETKSLFISYRSLISTINNQINRLENNSKQLKKKNGELKIINERLRLSEAKLIESNEFKDKFLMIIGHDLKSPMSTLTSLLENLFENINNFSKSEKAEFADGIKSTANSVLLLIENLLAWSQTKTNNYSKDILDVPLDGVLSDNLKLYSATINLKDIEVILKTKKGLEVKSSPNILDFVIRNILDNAIKFTPEEGTIIITSKKIKDKVTITIKDTGIGMDEITLKNLFAPGNEIIQEGTNGEKGSGIGLSLCYELIKTIGGDIIVESQKDMGTSFKLQLPASS